MKKANSETPNFVSMATKIGKVKINDTDKLADTENHTVKYKIITLSSMQPEL